MSYELAEKYLCDTASEGTDITKESPLTLYTAFENNVNYGLSRGNFTLRIVNRLLKDHGLEIALLDEDFGSEIAFVVQKKDGDTE